MKTFVRDILAKITEDKKYVRTVFLGALAVFVLFFLSYNFGYKKSDGTFFSLYKPKRNIEYDIMEKITEGIAMLKSSEPLAYETKNDDADGSITNKQIALAIFDSSQNEVFEHRVWVSESEVQNAHKTGIVNLIPNDPESDITVKVKWWNSFNTPYDISNKPNMIVVANKYLVSRDYLPEQTHLSLIEDGPISKYTSMVYAPYSPEIHWPEVIEAGKDYLNNNIDSAFEELRELKIESKAVKGKLLADVVSKDTVRTIALVEHVDPKLLDFATDDGRRLAERVLVILGANREWGYRYTSSFAGASGLAQFIKPTYDSMVEQYPDANLIEDYSLGMANHFNSIKAMALFLDSHQKFLQDNISSSYVENNGITASMLSATYNGGPGRVIRAVESLGEDWEHSDVFPSETSNYVEKFSKIQSLDIF